MSPLYFSGKQYRPWSDSPFRSSPVEGVWSRCVQLKPICPFMVYFLFEQVWNLSKDLEFFSSCGPGNEERTGGRNTSLWEIINFGMLYKPQKSIYPGLVVCVLACQAADPASRPGIDKRPGKWHLVCPELQNWCISVAVGNLQHHWIYLWHPPFQTGKLYNCSKQTCGTREQISKTIQTTTKITACQFDLCICLDFVMLSTIFQSYHTGLWMW